MGMSATEVDRKPFLWEPDKALNFPDIWELICKYHPEGNPVSREIIACIFFEETAFCNRKQKPGPAVGFGQIQIYDNDKIPFFDSIGYNSDKKKTDSDKQTITYDTITNDKELSVKLSCLYFQWLVNQGKSLNGALMAQTGGGNNAKFGPLFIEGGKRLRQAINEEQTRESFAEALNYARANGIHQNSIPIRGVNAYTKFWEFVIPEEYIMISLADY
jgi:hypothetical protein